MATIREYAYYWEGNRIAINKKIADLKDQNPDRIMIQIKKDHD